MKRKSKQIEDVSIFNKILEYRQVLDKLISSKIVTKYSKITLTKLINNFLHKNKIPLTKNEKKQIRNSISKLDPKTLNLLSFIFLDEHTGLIGSIKRSVYLIESKSEILHELVLRTDERDYIIDISNRKKTASQKYTIGQYDEYKNLYNELGVYNLAFHKLQQKFPELKNSNYKNFHTTFLQRNPTKN